MLLTQQLRIPTQEAKFYSRAQRTVLGYFNTDQKFFCEYVFLPTNLGTCGYSKPLSTTNKEKKESESVSDGPEAEQIDEPDQTVQIDEPDLRPSTSATPELQIPSNCRNRLTQTYKKQGTRSVRTQTVVAGTPMSSPTKQFLECPSFSEAQAVGEVTAVVTDIENAQPREPNEPKDAAQTSTITEVDVDSMASSVSKESAASGSHIPVDVLSSTESDESSEEDPNFDKRTVLVEGKPPQDQIKFIVFEEAILDVFGQCVQCGSKCVISAENQIGSCFKI